jgi:hypothetical protein
MTCFDRSRFRVLAVAVLATTLFHADEAQARASHRGFDLFAAAHNLLLRGNRVQCNINDVGLLCADPNNSPNIGGGFWPRGTSDQYIFQGGLNFAALIIGSPQPGFPWPGDTVGGWFMDLRGDQEHGEALTPIADGLDAGDWLRWPSAGRATDPALFAPALLGRNTVSDQDSWVRYWDGGTGQNNGRKHPAGLMVDQRTMSFDSPGLEDVIFVVFRLVNVTARNPAAYQGLAAAGYGPEDIAAIAALGATFQDRMERKYQIQIPDDGYAFDSMYVAFIQDPDVASGQNYSNANLVFSTSIAYQYNFREPTWQYPVEIFAPPFAQAPGFAATAFLRTPPSVLAGAPRIWFSGNFSGGSPFPDAIGVARLWRNNSGNLQPNDGTCSVPNAPARHFCYWGQVPYDTRFFLSTGPSRLGPGESAVLVTAQVFAPAIESAVAPFTGPLGLGMLPGFPVDGARLVSGLDTLRTLDRAAGWVSHTDLNGDGKIDAGEVLTTPRSLYWKIQAAQAAFDRGFLVPSAPDAPDFYTVPGDHRATVVWRPSATETAGDPYFQVAANPASPLYDPDYRDYDVEGYRVWRGRSVSSMQVIAQFDYAGTFMQDYTGQFVGPVYGNQCAPELGVTISCPSFPIGVGFHGDVVQTRLGDRVLLQNGAVAVLHADTAVTGGSSGRQPLRDTGVPFVFVDSTVRNGETYVYGVTAFDVNSVRSGVSTSESPLAVKAVTPRVPSGNTTPAVVVLAMLGDDSIALDPTQAFPAVDSLRGTFRGPVPPANGGSLTLLNPVAELLAAGDYTVRIDSSSPGFTPGAGLGIVGAPRLHVTVTSASTSVRLALDLDVPYVGFPASYPTGSGLALPLIPYDSMAAARFGLPPAFAASGSVKVAFTDSVTALAAHSGTIAIAAGRFSQANPASRYLAHSRWFDDGGSEPPDPTISFNPSPDHNSGYLTGVTAIWAPMAYRSPSTAGGATQINVFFRGYGYGRPLWHPADFVVTWLSGGSVTVRDETHHVNLPVTRGLAMGYGFLNASALQAAGVTSAGLADGTGTPNVAVPSYHALYAVDPVCRTWKALPCAALGPVAQFQLIDFNSDGLADGSGIILVVNGEAFFMTMFTLPAPGTKWHLRAVGGDGMNAVCAPALPPSSFTELLTPPTDCSGYQFAPATPVRSALAPGLRFRVRVVSAYHVASAAAGSLAAAHTVPDPYYFTNSLEAAAGRQMLRFVNLPDRAIIRIYSAGGALTAIVNHNDATGGGEEAWDLRTRGGRPVASGVYFFHVEAADGQTRVGRFVVVNGR